MFRNLLNVFLALVVFMNIGAPVFAQNPDRDTRTPSSSDDDVLARFVQECVKIVPGEKEFPQEFQLGTPKPTKNELSARTVKMNAAFRVSKYEVTQELYKLVMNNNPSRWKGPRNSAEKMTIAEAIVFCEKLTGMLRERQLIGKTETVRLPTYVEWEYCCRAGSASRYSFGDSVGDDGGTELLDEYAWHTGNAAGNDPAVGVLKPNNWGLFDVHGYLWEFVDGPVPEGISLPKEQCLIRGGAWTDKHPLLSSSTYLSIPAATRGDQIGFRCVIAAASEAKKASGQ